MITVIWVCAVSVLISGCTANLPPDVDVKTVGNFVVDARESIALARAGSASENAPQELARAESLIEEAQRLLRKGRSRDAADLAFLADTEAKIAIALSREAELDRQMIQIREGLLETILETKTDQVAVAEARQAIAERKALEAQKQAEETSAQANEDMERAKVGLDIAKVDLELSAYRDMVKIDDDTPEDELPPYAKEAYVKASSLLQEARSVLTAGDFQEAIAATEEAAGYASNATIQAKAKLDMEAEESLRARDKAVAAITKAELSFEEAEESLTGQYAEDMHEKAGNMLKEAALALKAKEYDRAESLAEKARVSASSALAVAEAKERETQTREAHEDARANALDAVAKAERAIAEAQAAGALEVTSDTYNQAQTALDQARQAMLGEDFEKALPRAQESAAYSSAAMAMIEAKSEHQRKTEETENSIREAATKIPEVTVRKTKKGVVISMGGDLFAPGSSQIKGDAQGRLRQVADLLKKYAEYKIIVEGHTDSVGSEESNLKISSERALNFLRYMVDHEKIPLERLSSVGYGESQPVASNINEAGRRQNRRVDIVILTTPISP